MASIGSWFRSARWTLTLPTVAVALTLFLLIIADHQETEYYRTHRVHSFNGFTDFMPHALSLVFFVNGPAFFPNPLPSPLKVTFAERLYTVLIAWLCVGMYADWKSRHPSTLLIRNRTRRLVIFAVLTVTSSVLAGLLLHDFWQHIRAYGYSNVWAVSKAQNFQVGLFGLVIFLGWLFGVTAWLIVNLVRSARMART
jgi:hypothetical protein